MSLADAGITEEDIQNVQTSWKPVSADLEKAGHILFIVMFDLFPTYENFFKRFKKSENESLINSPLLLPHIQGVMRTLDEVIVKLTDDAFVIDKMTKLGASHKKRNVKSPQFNHITEIVLETLKRVAGVEFTPEIETSWSKVLKVAMSVAGAEADK